MLRDPIVDNYIWNWQRGSLDYNKVMAVVFSRYTLLTTKVVVCQASFRQKTETYVDLLHMRSCFANAQEHDC